MAAVSSVLSALPAQVSAPRHGGGVLRAFWYELTRDLFSPYRPELHYMRGPGPAWYAKHGRRGQAAAD